MSRTNRPAAVEGPAVPSRVVLRPPSRPMEHLRHPYGGGGMLNLTGLCALLQADHSHCRYQYQSHPAALGMRSRRRGALLVLPAGPLIRRGHHHASRRSSRATCLDVGRSSSMLCGHTGTSNSSVTSTPVDLPTQRATGCSAGGHGRPNPKGNSWHVRTLQDRLRHRLEGW